MGKHKGRTKGIREMYIDHVKFQMEEAAKLTRADDQPTQPIEINRSNEAQPITIKIEINIK